MRGTMRRVIAIVVGVWCFCAAASAQGHPDFSGRWTSDPEPSAATAQPARGGGPGRGGPVGEMGSGWGSTITVAQDAKALTVEYAFFGRGDMMQPLRFTYALDGSETSNKVMMGRGMQTQTSRTSWAQDALVITTTYPFTDPTTNKASTATVTRTLRLDSPASLAVETEIGGVLGGPPSKFRTVYRKLQ
jgi:hypothetical protein